MLRNNLFLEPFVLLSIVLLSAHASYAQDVSFKSYSSKFDQIVGSNPKSIMLKQSKLPLFHEAAVYYHPTRSLFITSDQINDPSVNNNKTTILIQRVSGLDSPSNCTVETINVPNIPYPNSGHPYITSKSGTAPTDNVIVYLGQGNLANNPPGGIFFLNPRPPYNATNLISSYGEAPLNSPNDVTVAKDGSIWFTDPVYGYEYGLRPEPVLPNQVYRFDPSDGSIRVMADGFGRPNGISFSADERTLYVGDTGALVGNGTTDTTGPRTIYAFDVMYRSGAPFLSGKRLFAMPDNQGPDGIKSDTNGNVYAGCGDGVNVWSPGGALLGKMLLPGGTANIGFGEPGELYAMSDTVLWKIQLSPSTVGAGPNL